MKPRRISLLLLLACLAMTLAGMTLAISARVAFGAGPAILSAGHTSYNSTSLRTSTVFGKGPELHLLPDIGPVGTRVSVAGLGYSPGAHIRIIFGSPNAEFMPQSLASASVAANRNVSNRLYGGMRLRRPPLSPGAASPEDLSPVCDGPSPGGCRGNSGRSTLSAQANRDRGLCRDGLAHGHGVDWG